MTEFHRDEARWVHRARFLEELRNPTGEFWRESELMIGQPPLGSYLMGLGLTLQGRDLDTNGFYNFHFGPDWNWRHGTMPDEAIWRPRDGPTASSAPSSPSAST